MNETMRKILVDSRRRNSNTFLIFVQLNMKRFPYNNMRLLNLRRALVACALCLCSLQVWAAGYEYSVDLTQVVDDRVQVRVKVPAITQDVTEYHMPKIVPGTYSIYDFGRFVHDLKAYDAAGAELPVERLDDNRWRISNAKQLHSLGYWVEDTWDTDLKNKVFEPGGTNFQDGKNFVLNNFGLFGFIQGMESVSGTLRVTRPADFYGSTAMIANRTEGNTDIFDIESYHYLADSPIMYCRPDTAMRRVGGADVLVSVFSPNDRVSSKAIMASLAEILSAQEKYLGGKLPVKKYAFVIYLTDGSVGGSGGMGALEHSYSSFYFMPESGEAESAEMMRDVAAHEFFHIVTPLSIHSEEIHNFDYISPKMSKHLWLYEGVTEYSASHVQVKYDLISMGEYLGGLSQKITMASYMNDTVPFTVMSAGCLDKYKSQYLNVYQKGALIGMAIDILLRDLSKGQMGIQDLLRKLAETYGKSNPFKDDELFDKITALTYPELRSFFRKHVEGGEPLPYADLFARVGLRYDPVANREVLTTGRVAMIPNRMTNRMAVASIRGINKFGEKVGYQEGDEIVRFAGMEVTTDNWEDVIAQFQGTFKKGAKVTVELARPDGKGGYTMLKRKAKAETVRQRGTHLITVDPKATEAQRAIRKAWINQ